MKRRVLFIPIHVSSMVEMFSTAEQIVADSHFEPLFFVFRTIDIRQAEMLKKRSLEAIGPGMRSNIDSLEKDEQSVKPSNVKFPFLKQLAQWVEKNTLTATLWHTLEYVRMRWKARAILQDYQIAAVVTIGDRHIGWETAFIREAASLQIPVLIIPYTLSDPQGAVALRLASDDLQRYEVETVFQRWLARRFPSWVFSDGDYLLFFQPLGNALAAYICGIMPQNPWSLGGGAANRMAVESQHIYQMLLSQGVSPQKMLVTGRGSADQIFQTIEAADPEDIRKELGIPSEKPILLCSVPHLGEHGLLPWDQHWQEIDFLFKTIASQEQAAVVLSLHPKSDPEAYQPLAAQVGAIISERRLYELLPICDLFVSTYSGAVTVAIGCGVPTVLIDFYGLGYTYFDKEPGLVKITQRDKFLPALQRFLIDSAYYDEKSVAQKSRGSEWILLDGQCTRRIADELYRLVDASMDGRK